MRKLTLLFLICLSYFFQYSSSMAYEEAPYNVVQSNEGYEIRLTEINSHYDILPFIHSIQFGIKISNLEIIIEKDYSEYYFKHKDGKVIMRAGGITLLGLGYVF